MPTAARAVGLCFTFLPQQTSPKQNLPFSPSPHSVFPTSLYVQCPGFRTARVRVSAPPVHPGALGKGPPLPPTSHPLPIKWDQARLEIPNSNTRQLTKKKKKKTQVKSKSAGEN